MLGTERRVGCIKVPVGCHWTVSGARACRAESVFKIGDEIAGALQADIETHERVAPDHRHVSRRREEGDGEARHASPAVTDLEQVECIDESEYLLLRVFRREHDGEDARGAREIPVPDLVTRT